VAVAEVLDDVERDFTAHAFPDVPTSSITPALTVSAPHLTQVASEMPHGGYKQSSYGKDFSIYALEDYCEIKHVMVSLG
jgi:hypothetical protein